MGKTITIKQFKAAFKKPDRPKDVKSKEKGELEKLIKELIKNAEKEKKETLQTKAQDLYEKAPGYFVDLLTYKIAKHYNDEDKLPAWTNNVPPDALQAALKKVFPEGTSKQNILQGMDDAAKAGDTKRSYFLYELAPETVMDHVVQRCAENLKNEKMFDKWKWTIPGTATKPFFRKVVATGNQELIAKLSTNASNFSVDELTELADAQPAVFIHGVLTPFKNNTRCIDMLKDSKLRDALKKDPKAWKKLVSETPQLSMFESVQKRLKEKGITDKKGMAAEVFDCLVSNDGIELTYFTNRFDSDEFILSGGTPEDKKARETKTKMVPEGGAPEKPATQCHNLLAVLRHSLEMLPGEKMDIKSEHIDGMLLTKPLDKVGGKGGLIDKSFQGNVVDDSGKPTKQILFTGNDEGKQSHTWLVIDGVPYDPVLGTTGDDVKKAKANEFDWLVPNKVGKSADGWYIVKDPTVKAAPNKHGFGSGYRLTKQPTKYGVTEEELK